MTVRVMHVVLTPRHSGAEILARDLCLKMEGQGYHGALAALMPAAAEFSSEERKLSAAGIELYFPKELAGKFARIFHLSAAFRAFRPDIVYCHSVIPILYGRLAALLGLRGQRLVSVLHAASNDDFEDPYLRRIEAFTNGMTCSVVAVGEAGAAAYTRRFNKKPRVIKNGIDLKRFRSVETQEARRRLGIARDMKLVLQVGRLLPVKGQNVSIEALAPMLQQTDSELWLVGLVEDEDYHRALRQIVSTLGLEQKARFLGSRSDIPDLLAAADLYVMPSLAEAHSIAMLEALASGVPVLASDIAPFGFAADHAGVRLVPHGHSAEFLAAASDLINSGRHMRAMDDLSIDATVASYAMLTNEICGVR
jgi:Glycosyltransferase